MSYKRPVPKTADHLREISKKLAEHAAYLETIARTMDDEKFEVLGIPSDDQRRRSLEFMEKWMHHARLSILAAKEGREDYGPHKAAEWAKHKKKKKKKKDPEAVSE